VTPAIISAVAAGVIALLVSSVIGLVLLWSPAEDIIKRRDEARKVLLAIARREDVAKHLAWLQVAPPTLGATTRHALHLRAVLAAVRS
jgi:hypothetical protein